MLLGILALDRRFILIILTGYTHPLATAFGASKLPPPPDLEAFDQLARIVEARLKASLRRLVVATYNNVGMPRAYCGSAGGFVIGLIGR